MLLDYRWDTEPERTYCSEEVEILFTALYNSVNEVSAKAYAKQGYSVQHDLVHMVIVLEANAFIHSICKA